MVAPWESSLHARFGDVYGNDGLGRTAMDMLSLSLSSQIIFSSYKGKLHMFTEFCHDNEGINPLEATTTTSVRYVAWSGERGNIGAQSLKP